MGVAQRKSNQTKPSIGQNKQLQMNSLLRSINIRQCNTSSMKWEHRDGSDKTKINAIFENNTWKPVQARGDTFFHSSLAIVSGLYKAAPFARGGMLKIQQGNGCKLLSSTTYHTPTFEHISSFEATMFSRKATKTPHIGEKVNFSIQIIPHLLHFSHNLSHPLPFLCADTLQQFDSVRNSVLLKKKAQLE